MRKRREREKQTKKQITLPTIMNHDMLICAIITPCLTFEQIQMQIILVAKFW